MFNWPAVRRGSEHGPWCITVTKSHQHFMHTSWPLLSKAGESTLPNSCAYYSVAAVIQTQGRDHHQQQLCGKEGGVQGWTEWKNMTVREKKYWYSSVMSSAGTPCAGDVTPRTGTHLKLCDNEENVPLSFP